MSKDPAVLFYTSDFITGTMLMSDEQRGKYIILLCLQHQQGGLSEEDMMNICKTYDKKIFSKFDKLEDGLYYNDRMKRESYRRKAYSESRSKNRKTYKTHDETYEKHMETETETVIKDDNIINIPFEDFWNLYDKKRDRPKCEKRWSNLKDIERVEIIEYLPAYVKSTPDKTFRKDPAVFLNNRSWENEIIKPEKTKSTGYNPDQW